MHAKCFVFLKYIFIRTQRTCISCSKCWTNYSTCHIQGTCNSSTFSNKMSYIVYLLYLLKLHKYVWDNIVYIFGDLRQYQRCSPNLKSTLISLISSFEYQIRAITFWVIYHLKWWWYTQNALVKMKIV